MRTRGGKEKHGSACAQRWRSVNAEKREAREHKTVKSYLQTAAEKGRERVWVGEEGERGRGEGKREREREREIKIER